jgi:CRISPR-associated endonuclease/helicase Cas3
MLHDEFIAHYREFDGVKQSAYDHCLNTSILARENTSKIGVPLFGEVSGLSHDLGKFVVQFKQYLESSVGLILPSDPRYMIPEEWKGKIDHSTAGAQILCEIINGKDSESMIILQILALCLVSHHSGLIDCLAPDGKDVFSERINKNKLLTHVEEVKRNCDPRILKRINEIASSEEMRKELKIVKDIANEKTSKKIKLFKIGLFVKFIFSCLIDADRIDTADFSYPDNKKLRNNGNYTGWDVLINRLEVKLLSFQDESKISKIRKKVADICRSKFSLPIGIYSLTVPTGGSKTYSSLLWAMCHAKKHKLSRIYYVLPFISIIDQNADDIRSVLEAVGMSGSVVLEHHSNLLPSKSSSKSRLLSENYDAPIVFITFVQFLNIFFSGSTRDARKVHQFANSVIIFDEAQSTPIEFIHLFNNSVNFLNKYCGTSACLCTATPPSLNKVDAEKGALSFSENQEIMEDVSGLFASLKRIQIFDYRKDGGWSEDEIVDLVETELKITGSELMITNTKSATKRLFKLCKLKFPDSVKVFHLSTSMCPDHRKRILSKTKERLALGLPTICVSTQLIEAGINIDFGGVIRYICALPSLAQGGGRCNREGKREIGRVIVINPEMTPEYIAALKHLPEIMISINSTNRVLDEFKKNPAAFDYDLTSVKAIERYYYYHYYRRAGDMSGSVDATSVVGRNDDLLTLLSSNNQSVAAYERINMKRSALCINQSFASASRSFHAINAPTEGIIVPYGDKGKKIIAKLCSCDMKDLKEMNSLLRQAQEFSVNIFPNTYNQLVTKGCIREVQPESGIMYLDERYYSEDFGVDTEIVGVLGSLII